MKTLIDISPPYMCIVYKWFSFVLWFKTPIVLREREREESNA